MSLSNSPDTESDCGPGDRFHIEEGTEETRVAEAMNLSIGLRKLIFTRDEHPSITIIDGVLVGAVELH